MNRCSARTKVTAATMTTMTTVHTKSSTQTTSTTNTSPLNRRRNHNQNNTSLLSSRKSTNSSNDTTISRTNSGGDVIMSNKQVILDLHKAIYTRMSHSYHHSHSSVALSSGGAAGVMTSPELTETHKQSPNGRDSVLRLNHPHRLQHLQHQNNMHYQNHQHVYHPPDLSWSFDHELMRQTPKLIRLAALTHQKQLEQRKHSISEMPSSPSSSSSAARAAASRGRRRRRRRR